MFGNDSKNDSSKKSLSSVDGKLSFSNENSFEPENIPIHTMKKDLQNIGNPQYFEAQTNEIEFQKPPKPAFSPATPDSKLRTSPFLSQDVRKETKTILASSPAVAAPPANIPISPASTPITFSDKAPEKQEKISVTPTPPTPHTPSSWGKLILVSCVIFLLIAFGAGGYYFWMNKKSVITKAPENIVPVPPKPVLALDKPNYLNIDIASTEKISLTEATNKYIQEIKEENPATPVEFAVVDSQNNPILFKDFSSKSGLSLPAGITDNLKDTFSLFIYLDEGQPRIGLAIDSNDLVGTNLKEALIKNEPSLISNMASIYLDNPANADDTPFTTSYYGGAEIRYKNIPIPTMSLDYTIFRDKLVIGTSKMTERSIIDYLTANGKVQGAEDVLEDIPEEALQNGNFIQ